MKAIVMPWRPPRAPPKRTSRQVRTASRNPVFNTLAMICVPPGSDASSRSRERQVDAHLRGFSLAWRRRREGGGERRRWLGEPPPRGGRRAETIDKPEP